MPELISIPDRWLQGFLHVYLKRHRCTHREAIEAAVAWWIEQEHLAQEHKLEYAS